MAAQVDSLDGRNPTFEEQNLLPRHATSVRGMSVFVATQKIIFANHDDDDDYYYYYYYYFLCPIYAALDVLQAPHSAGIGAAASLASLPS